MAFVNAQQTRVLYGSQAISSLIKDVKTTASRAMLEVSTLADTSKAYIAGLSEWQLSFDGYFDNVTTAGSPFDQLTSPLAAATTVATSVAPNGFAAGNPVWLVPAKTITYEVKAQVEGVTEFSAAFGAGSAPQIGISLADVATLAATTTGSSQDNTTSSLAGAVAQLHVTAVSGTTPTLDVTIEHSSNGSSWSTVGTFTQVTAIGSQVLSIAGTVNRYTRAKFTIAGTTPSFTCQVSIARF